MDWDYESDETDPKTIFIGPKDSDDTTGLVGHNNKDTISDVESAIRNMPMTEDHGVILDDELEHQGKMFFGGIWSNSTWAEDMDLYDDHKYWECEDDAIMGKVDPKEEDPEENPEEEDPEEDPEEEDPEEDPEEEVQKGKVLVEDSKDESFTGSNTTL